MMKKVTNLPILKHLLIFVLIGAILFFIIQYIDYKLNLISQSTENNNIILKQENILLQNKITNLEKNIGELENIFNTKFEKEKTNNDVLANKFNKINTEITVLSKLSKLDEELLKKYSKVYFLNEHYKPPSLIEIPSEYLSPNAGSKQILTQVLPFLQNMIDDAVVEGVNIKVQSAYRSFETQAKLKNNYTLTYGTTSANKFSADQGYSEHQLGTTLDLTTGDTQPNLNGFEKTKEYEWMKNNAHKYGFILSYPHGNTYYRYEPWHWRFVGVSLASYLHKNNLNFYDVDEREILDYLPLIFD